MKGFCNSCKYCIKIKKQLRCTYVFNINARNLNLGSNRLVSMDTGLKLPYTSFEVDKNDTCGGHEQK